MVSARQGCWGGHELWGISRLPLGLFISEEMPWGRRWVRAQLEAGGYWAPRGGLPGGGGSATGMGHPEGGGAGLGGPGHAGPVGAWRLLATQGLRAAGVVGATEGCEGLTLPQSWERA